MGTIWSGWVCSLACAPPKMYANHCHRLICKIHGGILPNFFTPMRIGRATPPQPSTLVCRVVSDVEDME